MPLTNNTQISDLVTYPLCMECLVRMIDQLEISNKNSEKLLKEYTQHSQGIDNEIKILTSNFYVFYLNR